MTVKTAFGTAVGTAVGTGMERASATALQVQGLRFAHPGRPPLLQDLSFELRAGTALCLLGPNGCGKTTLLRCILGLEKLAAGRVLMDGKDISTMNPSQRAKHMAYVPQVSAGAFPFTVFDVVLMGRSAHLRFMADPDEHDRSAARDALARLDILPLQARLYDQLSGGERQLVLLARALAQQAPLLVMDEPCTGLDLGHQVQVLQAMRSLAADGYAVLLSTHLPEHAFALHADVALLANGQMTGPAPAAELLTAAELTRLYGTPVDLVHVQAGAALGQRVCVPVLNPTEEWMTDEPAQTTPRHTVGLSDLATASR
jgi:iron complex transport system ATP-binding protein